MTTYEILEENTFMVVQMNQIYGKSRDIHVCNSGLANGRSVDMYLKVDKAILNEKLHG